jgi:hypothetical protein
MDASVFITSNAIGRLVAVAGRWGRRPIALSIYEPAFSPASEPSAANPVIQATNRDARSASRQKPDLALLAALVDR